MTATDQGRGRRDARLAWIIIGCSATATIVLLIAGLLALRAPLARWADTLAAGNSSAPAVQRSEEVGKSAPDADPDLDRAENNLAGEAGADPPPAVGEVRKRGADDQPDTDDGDATSVRRGHGPHERHDLPPERPPGPIA